MQNMKNHEYSWELLYHFNCGECKNWWSYSTTESRYQWKNQMMSCPHCGYRVKIQPKDISDYPYFPEDSNRDDFVK